LVSTIDLLVADDLTWLPSPHDLEWLPTFRAPIDDGVYRIGHAPTNRAIKSTEALIAASRRLSEEMPVELVIGEKLSWHNTLALKGTVDVFFDQVILGYGNNAIEAWGMGIPVIAGGAPDTLAKMWSIFGELPFYQATEDTIYEALRALADPKTRKEWAERGRRFVERFHAYPVVVDELEAIYTDRVS
jgi:glycosyltransferase involved in cell wall biosynthesis